MDLFTVNGTHYQNKKQAKEARNACPSVVHVSKGPDHKDYGKKVKTHIGSSGHKSGQSIGGGFKKRK